ncbi:MAG: hypothetical protein JST80_03030 [Bdellovibrionales bacterium]|nr:hypothetical protein [Bdellovibrionales bacterium]
MKIQFLFLSMTLVLGTSSYAQLNKYVSDTDCESSLKWSQAVSTFSPNTAFVKYCQGQIDYLFSKSSKTTAEQSHLSKMTIAKSSASTSNPGGMNAALKNYTTNKTAMQSATCKDPKNPLAQPTQPINGKCLPGYTMDIKSPTSATGELTGTGVTDNSGLKDPTSNNQKPEQAKEVVYSQINGVGVNADLQKLRDKATEYNNTILNQSNTLNSAKTTYTSDMQKIKAAEKTGATVTINGQEYTGTKQKDGTYKYDDAKQAAKKPVTTAQNSLDTTKSQAKKDAKAEMNLERELDIENKNSSGQYGGLYNGADKGKSAVINNTIQMGVGLANQITQTALGNKASNEQLALQSKGYNATQADAINSQVNDMNSSRKGAQKMALVTTAAALIQGNRTKEILASKAKVTAASNRAYQDIAEKTINPATGTCTSKSGVCWTAAEAQAVTAQVNYNRDHEHQAQDQHAFEQAAATAQTMMAAAKLNQDANQMKKQAEMMAAMAQQTTGGTFAYNPGTGGVTDPGGNPDNNPNIDNQVVTTGPEAGIDTSGDGPINTDAGDGGVAGPAADKFNAMDPSKNGGGSGAPLNMQGGSTSAANDAKGGDQVAPGKAQAGGQYAAGDNAGVGSRFSAGSKGPAADTSFMDMMKNLLGGEDKGNHQGVEAMVERSVASDQPSVLSRNKNLFQEISKSYQKKSSEGAIVFSGDRS